jgi:hypothetical protein
MHYEINVSLNGHHFFATHERSITNIDKLKKVLDSLEKAFPKSEGYEISATRYSQIGEDVKFD